MDRILYLPDRIVTVIATEKYSCSLGNDLSTTTSAFQDRCNETLSGQGNGALDISGDRILKVFTERQEVKEFLTHPRFVLHDDESTADILWFNKHFKDFE